MAEPEAEAEAEAEAETTEQEESGKRHGRSGSGMPLVIVDGADGALDEDAEVVPSEYKAPGERTPSSNRLGHARNASVGRLVSPRIQSQTPSLIQLLDHNQVDVEKIQRSRDSQSSIRGGAGTPLSQKDSHGHKKRDSTPLSPGTLEQIKAEETAQAKMETETLQFISAFQNATGGAGLGFSPNVESMDALDAGASGSLGAQVSKQLDMKDLALQAAQEFMNLTTENDALMRANEALQVQLDEMREHMTELEEQVGKKNHDDQSNSMLQEQLDQATVVRETLEMQLKVLQERIEAMEHRRKSFSASQRAAYARRHSESVGDSRAGRPYPSDMQSVDGEEAAKEDLRLALENVQEAVTAKEELQERLNKAEELLRDKESQEFEYEARIQALRAELVQQQAAFLEFRDQVDAELDVVDEAEDAALQVQEENLRLEKRMRGMTIEKRLADDRTKTLEKQMAEQKRMIASLEMEKNDLVIRLEEIQTNKMKEDDEMFDLLQELQAQAINVRPQHSAQPSLSATAASAFADGEYFHLALATGAGGHSRGFTQDYYNVRAARMWGNEEFEEEEEETIVEDPEAEQKAEQEMAAEEADGKDDEKKEPTEEEKKAEEERKKAEAVKKAREAARKLKREKTIRNIRKKAAEIQKAAAEREFFFLTCLAVKNNIAEEYPDIMEDVLLNESPVEYYKLAQAQAIPMFKFSVWVDARIREKYDLPQLVRKEKFKLPIIGLRRPSLHLKDKFVALHGQIRKMTTGTGGGSANATPTPDARKPGSRTPAQRRQSKLYSTNPEDFERPRIGRHSKPKAEEKKREPSPKPESGPEAQALPVEEAKQPTQPEEEPPTKAKRDPTPDVEKVNSESAKKDDATQEDIQAQQNGEGCKCLVQ